MALLANRHRKIPVVHAGCAGGPHVPKRSGPNPRERRPPGCFGATCPEKRVTARSKLTPEEVDWAAFADEAGAEIREPRKGLTFFRLDLSFRFRIRRHQTGPGRVPSANVTN